MTFIILFNFPKISYICRICLHILLINALFLVFHKKKKVLLFLILSLLLRSCQLSSSNDYLTNPNVCQLLCLPGRCMEHLSFLKWLPVNHLPAGPSSQPFLCLLDCLICVSYLRCYGIFCDSCLFGLCLWPSDLAIWDLFPAFCLLPNIHRNSHFIANQNPQPSFIFHFLILV